MDDIIVKLLSSILTLVVVVITYYVRGYLRSLELKVRESAKDIEDEHKRKIVDSAIDTVHNVVDMVSQTFTESLKKSGKFDREAQHIAFGEALDKIENLLSEEVKNVISEEYYDLNSWIEVQIESYILSKRG